MSPRSYKLYKWKRRLLSDLTSLGRLQIEIKRDPASGPER